MRLHVLDAMDAGESGQADALAVEVGVAAGGLTGIVDDAWGWTAQVQEASDSA